MKARPERRLDPATALRCTQDDGVDHRRHPALPAVGHPHFELRPFNTTEEAHRVGPPFALRYAPLARQEDPAVAYHPVPHEIR